MQSVLLLLESAKVIRSADESGPSPKDLGGELLN